MGFRFRKSVKIAPGVRLNLGKKSTSVTLGGKGARYTVSSTGRRTKSVSVPGTGLSYSESTKSNSNDKINSSNLNSKKVVQEYSPRQYKQFGIILVILNAMLLLLGIPAAMVGVWVVLPIGGIGMYFGIKYMKMGKSKGKKQEEKLNRN